MSGQPRIEPPNVVEEVEAYVSSELSDAEKYTNRTPLDESGIWSLHALAARIYAIGWRDGERATAEKSQRERNREHDRRRAAVAATPAPRLGGEREGEVGADG